MRKAILRFADACFTHGKDAEGYLRSLGYRGPVVYTPYAIASGLYEGERFLPGRGVCRVFSAGQLIERKGIVPFTEALCAWCAAHPEQCVEFRIGGEGPQRKDLAALAAPPNLSVKFLGHLDHDRLSLEYRSASFYAFPTLADEWGMVVHESLSAGLPILASIHAQASVEMVQDGENGWLFDPEDAVSVERGIDRAVSSSPLALAGMGERARESVQTWTPSVMAGRMARALGTMSVN